jgi:hypothetical protein
VAAKHPRGGAWKQYQRWFHDVSPDH